MTKVAFLDVDQPDSWPDPVREFVEDRAERLRGTTEYTFDLRPDEVDYPEIRRLLDGFRVKAYHATRLLDHEAANIRANGLRLLTEALVVERIEEAHRRGYLSDAQRDHLLRNNVFSRGWQVDVRENRISTFLSRSTLDEHANGLWRLLAQWGGEGIYWVSGEEFEPQLRSIGRASIVVASLDLSDPDADHLIFPGLLHAFVGTWLGLEDGGAVVHYVDAIPGGAIIDIWHPGDPDYDRHPGLYRA